jgi:phosphonate transport system substrate-binding protein
MRGIKIWVAFVVVMVFAMAGIYRELEDISYTRPMEESAREVAQKGPIVMIGVISRYAPSRIYQHYQPLIDYLSRECNFRVQLKLSRSYEETVQQLDKGEVLAAFLGSYIYARARTRYDLKPLVVPLNRDGLPFSRAALVVQPHSSLHAIADLSGHSLALPSRSSFSANWLNDRELNKYGISTSDLKSIQYFDYHHTVIFQVLWGKNDAGVVRESIADEYRKEGIEVIAYSDPFPAPPLVCRKDANPEWIERIQKALLRLSANRKMPGELSSFYGFGEAEDWTYEEMSRTYFNEADHE